MYPIALHAHSAFRWIVLILLVTSVLIALLNKNKELKNNIAEKKVFLYTMMFTHLQFVFGLLLYFISPKVVFTSEAFKNTITRFFLAEHSLIMIIAITFITIGYSKFKRTASQIKARKTVLLFYLMGLVLILAGIPWPFRGLGSGLF